VIAADYLIDDEPRHCARFGGEGILFTAPQNRQVTGYRRVDSWAECAAPRSRRGARPAGRTGALSIDEE
jgi:5'(3')-deoxyribonucleotidase